MRRAGKAPVLLTFKKALCFFKRLCNHRKELIIMDNCKANKSIECSVTQCRNHCSSDHYCALDKIQVGTHEADPTVKQCTDCMSFEKK